MRELRHQPRLVIGALGHHRPGDARAVLLASATAAMLWCRVWAMCATQRLSRSSLLAAVRRVSVHS